MSQRSLKCLASVAVVLALIVVMLGAYTRLTDAGLGCPDWPGCYGHIVLPQAHQALTSAQKAYPQIPIEQGKAWTEMIHRYAAGTLGIIIIILSSSALRRRIVQQPPSFSLPWAIFLLGLLIFQATLGMWTVTLKLLPIVVMAHLLGGILIFSSLSVIALQIYHPAISQMLTFHRWRPAVALGLMIVLTQIALGGWVSANYAGTACIGFPQCNGQWLPSLQLAEGFNLISPVGENYQGGLLDSSARVTIQFIHRIGALVTLIYISTLMLLVIRNIKASLIRRLAFIALFLITAQFIIGVINVVYLLPLVNAVAHNGVAALLAAVMMILLCLSGKRSYEE